MVADIFRIGHIRTRAIAGEAIAGNFVACETQRLEGPLLPLVAGKQNDELPLLKPGERQWPVRGRTW